MLNKSLCKGDRKNTDVYAYPGACYIGINFPGYIWHRFKSMQKSFTSDSVSYI